MQSSKDPDGSGMATHKISEIDVAPKLVVKIIGSKQVKYFIQEEKGVSSCHREKSTTEENEKSESAAQTSTENKALEDILDNKTPEPAQTKEKTDSQECSSLQVQCKQASSRRRVQCVTAPSGDASLSYIHYRTIPAHRADLDAGHGMWSGEKKGEGHATALLMALNSELSGWNTAGLQSIAQEVAELDFLHIGTVSHPQLACVFMNNSIPLRLPTLRLLLQAFSSVSAPDQVFYKGLLNFIREAVVPVELQEDAQTELEGAAERVIGQERSPEEASSKHPGDMDCSVGSEHWLQRFQRAEKALRMWDTQNTGYIDRDQAKHLIHNYNLILKLNLSPLKINKAIYSSQSGSKVHLDSALQCLKER